MLELKNVSKFYYGKGMVSAGFSKVSLKFEMGEFIAITGESGSGKSTLLNVISGLDSYEEGEMYINGEETSHYTEKDYELYRKKYIANIFQAFNLVNSYTVYQNVELILLLRGEKRSEVKEKVLKLIKDVDLYKYRNKKVSKLSGGQKQRVAIARALAIDSPIIVADEPTGNLDKKSSTSVLKLLHDLSKDKLVIVVTHNYDQIEDYVTRKITMHDGKVLEDKQIKKHNEIEVKNSEFKDTTLLNKLRLGFRNAFNVIPKFLLICFIYLFVVISLYSSFCIFNVFEEELEDFSYNIFFENATEERIVIKKNDKTTFNDEDYEKISKIDKVNNIVKNDIMIEARAYVDSDQYYFSGIISEFDDSLKVDIGRLPTNDNEVVAGIYSWKQDDEYYSFMYKDIEKIYSSKFKLSIDRGYTSRDVNVVGIQFIDETSTSGNNLERIYVGSKLKNLIEKDISKSYITSKYTFNGREEIDYDMIIPSSKVKKGTAIIPEEYSFECKNMNCKNYKIKISASDINFNDDLTVKVSKTYNKKNINKLTGYDYKKYSNNIFINENDYNNLFYKGYYQSSVYVNDKNDVEKVISELNDLGYTTLNLKETMKNKITDDVRVLNIIKVCLLIGLIITLFYISYFIIKLILKSRNIYYSTLRLIGATHKCTKELLKIELLVVSLLSYSIFIIFITLVNKNIIKIEEIKEFISMYSENSFYLIVLVIVIIMSLLISNRYARKLFKNSVMNTYKEEV